jgi:adenylate cyclase
MLAERANAESQALLRKILPDFVIARLMAAPEASIADHFADASVLFADIQGFVAIAKQLGNARTVALLDHLTREFDALALCHGVEKIKTIGDGYMAVAGVPHPQPDHCERLASGWPVSRSTCRPLPAPWARLWASTSRCASASPPAP